MAKIQKNLFLQGVSGGVGGQMVLRRLRDGRTILCAMPDFSNREFSEAQLNHQQRFQEASAYARQAAKEQPLYAQLAAGTMKTAYNIALSDWFHPPAIQRIERQGDTLRVLARDNVRVARVWVTVLDGEAVVEQAEAAEAGSDWWQVAAPETDGRIVVQAKDLAGNVAEMEYALP
jgi:hypothetical protein